MTGRLSCKALPPMTGDSRRWPDVANLAISRQNSLSACLERALIIDDDLITTVRIARSTLAVPWSNAVYFDSDENQQAFANIWNACVDEQNRRCGVA